MQLGTTQHERLGRRTTPSATARTRRRGATTVEFAFIAPLLFLMIFGILEFGRALMVSNLLADAAREGCRIGAMQGKSTADITATTTELLKSRSVPSQTSVTVQVNGVTADPATADSGSQIKVVVSVPVSAVTLVPTGGFLSGNLTGQYTLNRE